MITMLARVCVTSLALTGGLLAQSFNGGSTGADGALMFTTPGTIRFDPRASIPQLNPAADNVYHFTSILIAKGTTVKLSASVLGGPVFWLVQGPVQIDGVIDLNGEDGGRVPAASGTGGYPGGAPKKHGYGPEADFKRNVFLVPLVGGSGGDGGATRSGGGGGGALLIASSISISVDGEIRADGGSSEDGVGGSGGAIRLVAPVIDGTGLLSARVGNPKGIDGRVRFEAFDNNFKGNLNETPFSQGRPFGLFLPPDAQPSVRVVSVGGMAVTAPEFTINQPSRVAVEIEARHIPPGAVIELQFFNENGSDLTIFTSPLEGTFALSRATAFVALSSGRTHSYVKVTWKQPNEKTR